MAQLFSFGTYDFKVETHEIVRENDKTYVVKDNFFSKDTTIRKSDMEVSGRIYAVSLEELKEKKRKYINDLIAYYNGKKISLDKEINKLKKVLEDIEND